MANFFSVSGIAAAVALLYLLLKAVHNVYFHPLRKYPGPKLWAATRFIWIYYQFRGSLIFQLKRLHDEYGPVVRIAPDELGFTSPAAWKDIYARLGEHELVRDPYIFPPSVPEFPSNIIMSDHVTHARVRRQLAYAFSAKALEQQQDLIMCHIDTLIRQFHRAIGPQNLADWMNFTSFDIIGDLAFGETFGCLASGAYHPWAAVTLVTFKAGIFMSAINRYGLLRFAPYFLPKKMMEQRQWFIDFTTSQVAKRMESKVDRPDFISYMMKANKDDQTMTQAEIQSNVTTLIIAGSESTGTLLTGTIFYLLKNPTTMARLSEEIRSAFLSENDINQKSVTQLPFTLACLEEGLRMATPAPFGMARRTTKPTMVAGELVPTNTSVSVPQFAAWHTSRNFSQPEKYMPERWLQEDGSYKAGSDFYPFSVGPRNCIGRNLAYLEMRLVLTRLIWNFDFELADRSFEWTKQKAFIVWDKAPMMVNVKPVKR